MPGNGILTEEIKIVTTKIIIISLPGWLQRDNKLKSNTDGNLLHVVILESHYWLSLILFGRPVVLLCWRIRKYWDTFGQIGPVRCVYAYTFWDDMNNLG